MLDLPTDRPRPPVQTYRGGFCRRLLPAKLLNQLKALSHREKTTLFITTLAAFKALLNRYSGQNDLVIGTPIAGCDQPELEGLIGYFTEYSALCTEVSGDLTFRELVGRVRETFLEAHEHQDLPFEKLVAELVKARGTRVTPRCSRFCSSLGHYAASAASLPDLNVSPLFVDRGIAKFDLSAGLTETPDVIDGSWHRILRVVPPRIHRADDRSLSRPAGRDCG